MKKPATFNATVADVKNGKTKIVVKFDAENMDRDQLANLNDLVNMNVVVTVKFNPATDEEKVAPGQTKIDDYIA